MTKNMINLYVYGGLCNRLRAIASAIKLAGEFKDNIVVYWPKNKELYAEFNELFKIDNTINIVFKDTRDTPLQFYSKMKLKLGSVACYRQGEFEEFLQYYKQASGSVECSLCTFSNFYGSCDYSWLSVQDFLQDKIKIILAQVKNNCVGIHIRRTDNKKAIENSPTELFVETMQKEIENDENVKFYLATDDIEVKRDFSQKFGKRLIINSDKKAERDTEEGMLDAVIDLLALANTKKIYGSYWSSFSEIAADIGNVELEIVYKNDED